MLGAAISAVLTWAVGRGAAPARAPAAVPFRPLSAASFKAVEAELDAERAARLAAEADARTARADLAGLSAQLEASNRTRRAVAAELSSAFGLGSGGGTPASAGRGGLFGGRLGGARGAPST